MESNLFIAGRIVFCGMLLYRAVRNFFRLDELADIGGRKGFPFPKIAAPVGMIWLTLGTLAILFNFQALVGGVMVALFLTVAGLKVHDFWNEPPSRLRKLETYNLEKNLGIAGAALAIAAACTLL